jgi:GAF domain-containing protein
MSDGRFPILPDENLAGLRPALLARLRAAATEACNFSFDVVFDAGMRALLLEGFRRVGADEGTIWLIDSGNEVLIPRFNSGPHATGFVGIHRQPLSKGMISMVVATEQPICENEVYKNERQDKEVDRKLGLRTCAMIAVPLVFTGELRGVISCVQIRPRESRDPDPPGFTHEHLLQTQLVATLLGRLLEARLLAHCLGFTPIS